MRPIRDRAMVAVAVGAGLGALWSHPVPLVAAGAAVSTALLFRRPVLLCIGAALLASCLGARSWDGLRGTPTSGRVAGVATLVTDPVDEWGGSRAELRLGRRRVEARTRGEQARRLRARSAGERVAVVGRLRPLTGRRRAYLLRRHVAAALVVDEVRYHDAGTVWARAGNGVRRLLRQGVASFPDDEQAMFAGIVLGDDRAQPPAAVEAFRASGLAHLLAVSGQNLAFVLALASPLLAFLGRHARLVAALVVLALFGVLTRWEPSVLRATAMAATSLTATAVGRPISTIRVLAIAVTLLLLADPLLVGSVGFLLSVGACTGIALLSGPLTRRGLPLALGVTLAAELGVAPVSVRLFGGLPVVSTAANLLAVPAAGPLMMWGMGAGLVAGVLGGRAAVLLHLPTRLLLAWVEGVAERAAALGLGSFRMGHVVALAALAGVMLHWRRARLLSLVAAIAVCASAATAACTFGPCGSPSATGSTTSPPGRWSWASSIGRPTRSSTRAPTSTWTVAWPERNSSWPRAPTSSTSAG
jgi:competence protein ComEC